MWQKEHQSNGILSMLLISYSFLLFYLFFSRVHKYVNDAVDDEH